MVAIIVGRIAINGVFLMERDIATGDTKEKTTKL